MADIESKPEQNNSILEQFFGAISQAGVQLFVGKEKRVENHSDKDGKNWCSYNRHEAS